MVADLDVATNAVLKRIGRRPFWRAGTERRDEIDRFAEGLVERFNVRTPDVHTRLATLSGGNVQKLLLARELAGEPRVAVFNKPTHGLDVRTAEFVRDQIREAAAAGLAALVISTEIEELVDLCDRIVVISRGELTGEVENTPGVEERVGALMVARGRGTAREGPGGATRRGDADRGGADRARAGRHRDPARGARARSVQLLRRHVRPRADPVGGLSGEHHPQRAAAPDRRRADRRLPGEPLEPRRGRPVPARRRVHRRPRPAAARVARRLADAADHDGGRGARRRRLDDHPRVPARALRGERDHHHADDVVHRHRRRQRARQGPVRDGGPRRRADRRDPLRRALPAALRHPHPPRLRDRGRGDPRRPRADDLDLARAAAAHPGGEPARGAARRAAPGAADA